MFANYHTHTWRCNHAESDERAYMEAAIAGGMKILGFSDHTPYPGLASWFRMEVGQAPEYFQTVRALRDESAGRIEIHAGVEAEYYPAHFSELMDLLRQNGCEYMILGQHYLDSETDSLYTANASADDGRLRRYADEVEEGIETGLFTYVAHPDVFRGRIEDLLDTEFYDPLKSAEASGKYILDTLISKKKGMAKAITAMPPKR